jgi:hypothetical protein
LLNFELKAEILNNIWFNMIIEIEVEW